jgi:hypothetical protein
MLERGNRVNLYPNGGTWVNACLNGGGLLQDTVSPMGDMVHFYLAKASFLQDMLLCLFVCFLFFFIYLFFFFWLYVIIFAQHSFPRQALHQYNISCIVVTKWRELH